MPSMTRRPPGQVARQSLSERRRLRRRELLDAAIDVIRREGPDVTMEEMATAGGISKPILYRHFVDRDGLVAAITETALVEIGEILDETIGEARADLPPHSIRATIDAFFEYIEREPQLYRFIIDSDAKGGSNLATRAFTEHIAERVAETLAHGLVERGHDSGAGGDLGAGNRRDGAEHRGVVDRRRRDLPSGGRRHPHRPRLGGHRRNGHRRESIDRAARAGVDGVIDPLPRPTVVPWSLTPRTPWMSCGRGVSISPR